MDLSIRLFAIARQQLGRSSLDVTLAEGATVGELRASLARREPDLARILPSMMIAVDSEYADDSRILRPESEVALIPPVSGG